MKEKIMKWYQMGLWSRDMVFNAVAKNVITEDEALEIVKEG